MKTKLAVAILLLSTCTFAAVPPIQKIQLVNLLENNTLPDAGMTPTSVLVKFYTGEKNPCFTWMLPYRGDYTFVAGPGQGCVCKATSIVIEPIKVADRLTTYNGPVTVNIDTTKYSTQVTILQKVGPLFDDQTGLVAKPGTMDIKAQAQGMFE